MGVGAVALLYAAVRRCSGPAAGLIAGAALALTPVAALMFRYNNPDALLVLLAGGGGVLRGACHRDGEHPLDGVGGLCPWIRVPDEDASSVSGSPRSCAGVPRRRTRRAVAADLEADGRRRRTHRFGGLVRGPGQPVAGSIPAVYRRLHRRTACCSWRWATTALSAWSAGAAGVQAGAIPAAAVSAPPSAAVRGGPVSGAGHLFFGGEPGIGRMFGLSMGTEASWLLPAALIGLVAGLWLTRRTARTGSAPRRACCCGVVGCW